MKRIKIRPIYQFNKYDFGIGFILCRENESGKYIRDRKTINYLFEVQLLWFLLGITIEILGEEYEER
jgi:hypothetical protein